MATIRVVMTVMQKFSGVVRKQHSGDTGIMVQGDIIADGTRRREPVGRHDILKVGYITTSEGADGKHIIYSGELWGAPPVYPVHRFDPLYPASDVLWYRVGDYTAALAALAIANGSMKRGE